MSWQAVDWVLEHSKSRLGHRLVLIAIAKRCDENGHNSWPMHTSIAAMANLSVREVVRAMEGLVQIGELLITPRKAKRGSRHTYSLPKMTSLHAKLAHDNLSPTGKLHAKLPNEHAKLAQITRQVGVSYKEKKTLNSPEQTKPEFISKNSLTREERERRQSFTAARKRSLRSFATHPIEDWESPLTAEEISQEEARCKKPAVGTVPSSWHTSASESIRS